MTADTCTGDHHHLFAYHSTSHVTLDIHVFLNFLVASNVPRIAYQIGRLPFICKGCCPLVAYFSKILYITSFLRVCARDYTRSIGGGGPGIGVFRDTSSDSGRVWVAAGVLAAGRGVVHITVCAWLCPPLRAVQTFVWVILAGLAFAGRLRGVCARYALQARTPVRVRARSECCGMLEGTKENFSSVLLFLEFVCLSMWYGAPLVFFSRKPGAFHLCYTVYVRVI